MIPLIFHSRTWRTMIKHFVIFIYQWDYPYISFNIRVLIWMLRAMITWMPIFGLLHSFSHCIHIHQTNWWNSVSIGRNSLLNTSHVFKHTLFDEFFFTAGILCFLEMTMSISTKSRWLDQIYHTFEMYSTYRWHTTDDQHEWNWSIVVEIDILTTYLSLLVLK